MVEVLQDVYGEKEAKVIAEAFGTAIAETRSLVSLSRPDLSGN